MSYKEHKSNYIYVLNFDNSYRDDYGEICLHAIDTHYMVACSLGKHELKELVASNKVTIRNVNNTGVSIPIDRDKKVVLFKYDSDSYIVSDYYCNLSKVTLEQIKADRQAYPDIKFVGKGITTNSGKIPDVNKRVKYIYKMQNFNIKAAMIGVSTLDFDFDYDNDLVITSIRNETDIVQIPNFAKYIANRAFLNSNIRHVNIGNGVKEIGSNAFAGCSKLESVELGNSVEVIGNRAFFSCQKLKKLVLNDNLKEIRSEAFAYSGILMLSRLTAGISVRVNDEIREMLQMYK